MWFDWWFWFCFHLVTLIWFACFRWVFGGYFCFYIVYCNNFALLCVWFINITLDSYMFGELCVLVIVNWCLSVILISFGCLLVM